MAGTIAEIAYAAVLTAQYNAVKAGMDRVLTLELAAVVPVLKSVLAVYVLVQFILFAKGHLLGMAFVGRLVRAVVVSFLLSNVWVSYVRDYAFEKIPTALAGTASGGTSVLTAPQQFENVSTAIDNLTADIRQRNTSWTVTAFGNSIMSWIVWGGLQFALTIQAYIWLTSIRIMALTLCVGVWLILFELFDRTRGFFQHWIGIVVGLWIFQLASSVQLQISLHSEIAMLRMIHDAGASNSVDQMIANMGHVGSALFGDALTMLALPALYGGVGGAAMQYGAASAFRAMPGVMNRVGAQAMRARDRLRGK